MDLLALFAANVAIPMETLHIGKLYLILYKNIQCVSKPMLQTFPGYSPPPLK